LISFTITLMVDWPAPQIALDLQKGARFAYSQLDHGPSWRCARETTGDPTRFGGHFQTSGLVRAKSVHPSRAETRRLQWHVRFVPIVLQKSFCLTDHKFSGL
jgi:hypothetical protein